ncbi:FUSC family protein [Sphingobacterium tabacisoli]|uniref:FUSC family membrane protein n=1 Tax=Sphingobacterium tabacisoli TaxID=2044855 RepID=A0ABW5KWE3_9SPHI|nr:FUSC family protein [Sphingobacterium tabacisoli]
MTRTVHHFFGKEFSKDALRNILVILLPAILLFYTVSLDVAIAFAVGVILSSLTDLPGNRQDKTMTAIWCTPLFAITAFSTALALHYLSWGILPILGIWGFLCTLLITLGPRWGVIGNLTLIVISFTIGLKPQDPVIFALSFSLGTCCFFAVSLLQAYLSPYRSLKYAMKEGFEQMATLLQAKIKCYDEKTPLEQVYRELSLLHIKISEQLENIRSLLLREKVLISSGQHADLIWLNKIYRLIDLYELLMGIDTDYETIREKLKHSEVLPIIRHILLLLSDEIKVLENIRLMELNKDTKNSRHLDLVERSMNYIAKTMSVDLSTTVEMTDKNVEIKIKEKISTDIQNLEEIQAKANSETRSLINPILIHIKHIVAIVQQIQQATIVQDPTWVSTAAYKNFVPTTNKRQIITKHIKTRSPIFIYSLRMATLLVLSGLVGYTLPEYRYASWIILTVILVARPSYATTQRRNYQRIVGSLIGIAISLLITLLTHEPMQLLSIAVITLYGFFLFNKPDYLICVIFITIAAILALHLYEGNIWDLLGSRLAFTLLGSTLALIGCFALPVNHQKNMKSLSDTLIDNYQNYYQRLRARLCEDTVDHQELRLVRKHAQTSLAQLYDSLDQFQKEPRYKKLDWTDLISFQTLAYRINALLVGISVSITKSIEQENDTALLQRLQNIEALINELYELGQSEKLANKAHKAPAVVS